MTARHHRTGMILECILQGLDDQHTIYEGSAILRTAQYILDQPKPGLELSAMIAGFAYSTAELLDDFQIPREAIEAHIRELLLHNEIAVILADTDDESENPL